MSTRARRFRLMRYFTLATLGVFLAAGVALFKLQRDEEEFFEQVQREQQAFFAQAQADLARRQAEAARASLLALHEASHVTLTGVVANLMWANDFAPLVARAQGFAVEPCRAVAAAEARKACHAALGERIRALPGFAALDAKARAAMQSTKVFKIKVWDLRGVTVYSSELAQIGEDGAGNEGWRRAIAGRPASELTHRDRFSAFEGVVENRDLISTYVPVRDESGTRVLGVFELYSDVTPFLEKAVAATRRFEEITAANQAEVQRASLADQEALYRSSERFLLTVGGLMALLYVASLIIVRIGQQIIDRQTLAEEQAARREQAWHGEKMAALAAMAANVSHEVGNPLAVIAGAVQELPHAQDEAEREGLRRTVLGQTTRIAQMMRQISDFAGAGSDAPAWVDLNPLLKVVCEFHGFDRRFRDTPVALRAGRGLPAVELVPDQFNELMMSLLQVAALGVPGAARPARIVVESAAGAGGSGVVVRVRGEGRREAGDAPANGVDHGAADGDAQARLQSAERLAAQMGARLAREDVGVVVAFGETQAAGANATGAADSAPAALSGAASAQPPSVRP